MPLLGPHVQVLTPDVLTLIRDARPGLVKTMDLGHDWTSLKAEHGIRFLVARLELDAWADLSPSPEGAAERLWSTMWPKLAPHRGAWDAVETPWNERFQRPDDRLADHARACRRFCELAEGEGLAVAVGNFSQGNPEPWHMEQFYPALEKARYLSVHEYWQVWGPLSGADWTWRTGRCERLLDALPLDLRRPVLVTEAGIDMGIVGKGRLQAGWRANGVGPAQYAGQIREYVSALSDRVVGVAVFNAGDYPRGQNDPSSWRSFEIAGTPDLTALFRDWPKDVAPVPLPTPAPVPDPDPDPDPKEQDPTMESKYAVYTPGALWQAIADPKNGLELAGREKSDWGEGGDAWAYVRRDGKLYRLVLLQDDGGLYLDGPLSPLA